MGASNIARGRTVRIYAAALAGAMTAALLAAAPMAAAQSARPMFDCGTNYPSNQNETQSTILQRAQSWIDEKVPYSQSACHSNDYGSYRTDCSGYVSMAWGLTDSYTTDTLGEVTTPINRADLQPGDALLRSGDHVAIFDGWSDTAHTQPIVVQEPETGEVARYSVWSASYAAQYAPVRYDGMILDSPHAPSLSDHVGDVNHDNYADLVGVDSNGELFGYNNSSLLPGNTGHVPFISETWRVPGSNWSSAKYIATADVTGDGYADLVAINADGSLSIYANGILNPGNNGIPYTSETWHINGNWSGVTGFTVGDVTGDGYADIVAINADGSLSIYANGYKTNPNHVPFAGETWHINGNWSGVKHVAVGDVFNHNGYGDLVGVDANGQLFGYNNSSLLPGNTGHVPFTSETWWIDGSDWSGATGFAIGDYTGDGYDDIAAINADGSLSIYANGVLNQNSGGVPYTSETWHINGNWSGVKLFT